MERLMSDPRAAQIKELLLAIRESRAGRTVTLVAIDGPGGSGKSTLARRLRDAADDITIVEGDDFYTPMLEAERVALSAREAYERNFDWTRLRDQVLAPLRFWEPRPIPAIRLAERAACRVA
jgi:Mg-chelatase subunit ChlI